MNENLKNLLHVSYISERWAVEDLTWGQEYFGLDLRDQIQDEVDHSKILRALIEPHIDNFVVDPDNILFAFQEIMFKNTARIVLSKITNLEVFLQMHNIMEMRAAWIYKTVLRYPGDIGDDVRNSLTKIIDDEKGHVHDVKIDHPLTKIIHDADRWLFKSHLKKFNSLNLLESDDFWHAYYVKKNVW